jgi:hypothetical protein
MSIGIGAVITLFYPWYNAKMYQNLKETPQSYEQEIKHNSQNLHKGYDHLRDAAHQKIVAGGVGTQTYSV